MPPTRRKDGKPVDAHGLSASVRSARRLLPAGAVGHGVRCERQAAARLGRPGRSRQVQDGGRLRLAGQRARHLRRPQRLRLSRRQQRQRRSERLGLGVDQRRRRHDPEVHQGRQVRDDDRRPGRQGAGQQQQGRRPQRHAAVLSAGRHHGRSDRQPHVCVGRLRQSPRGHRRCRDRQVHRPFRRLRQQPDRRQGRRRCRHLDERLHQGQHEAGLLPQRRCTA